MKTILISLLAFSFSCLAIQAEEKTLLALCYGPGLYGNKTASGQVLTKQTIGAAHRKWSLGSNIKLKCNGKNINIKIIDRGPYTRSGSLDLTEATVKKLGYVNCADFGIRSVEVEK